MDTRTALLLSEDLMDKYGIGDRYIVRINPKMHAFLGRCHHPRFRNGKMMEKGLIELSEMFCCRNEVPRVEQTIKHEICHALTGPGHPHHGLVWKSYAIKLSVPPVACAGGATMGGGKWFALCRNCHQVVGNIYKGAPKYPKELYNCRRCKTKDCVQWYENHGEMD